MSALETLPQKIRRFLRDTRGGLSVEAALAFPLLVWAYSALFVYWDAYKVQNNNAKATYTIADMISRETTAVNATYLVGMNKLFSYMTLSNHRTKIRVSVISRQLENDGVTEFNQLNWSNATNGLETPSTAAELATNIPVMAVGDQVILVETLMVYEPVLNIGLGPQIFGNSVATRPRFVPQVLWTP